MFMKRALVLSGGGAKGAYQIGVWKALRKLHIPIHIVTGTSVGALNGAMIVQGSYGKAKKLWKNMSFNIVFDEKVISQFNHCSTTKDMIGMFTSNFFQNGGMDVQNLENVVHKYLCLKKFARSKVDFGISTYNFTDHKPLKLKKDELLQRNVVDYVIASSTCYPAFKMRKIGSKKYIDGGFFDYIPINLALEMGADEIIAVDLHAPGIREKVRKSDVPITYIEPKNDIGGFLNFNKENANAAIVYGYFDTMKAFGKLEGDHYTFQSNILKKCQGRYNESVVSTMNYIFDFQENKTTLEELLTLAAYKRMVSLKKGKTDEIFLDIFESLASIFRLSDRKIYGYWGFHYEIFHELKHAPILNEENIRSSIHNKSITSYLNRRSIIRYFIHQIELCYQDSSHKKPLCKLALIFPKEFLDALYLYAVKKRGLWPW